MAWDLSVIVPLVVSVLTAVGFSSLLAQWASGTKDRRTARAAALGSLRKVEEERWFGADSEPAAFKETIREFETSMLLARVPAAPVALYVALASTAYRRTRSSYEEYPGEDGGSLETAISDYTRRAARILLRYIWAPHGLHRIPDRVKLRYLRFVLQRLPGEAGQIFKHELSKVGTSR